MKKFDEEKFLRIYRGNEKFLTEDAEYYHAFLELLNNKPLLRNIKFANDVCGVPPLQTFILYMRDYKQQPIFDKPLTRSARHGLGACFGYLYKQMYPDNYQAVQCWFNDQLTGLKTASKFVKK